MRSRRDDSDGDGAVAGAQSSDAEERKGASPAVQKVISLSAIALFVCLFGVSIFQHSGESSHDAGVAMKDNPLSVLKELNASVAAAVRKEMAKYRTADRYELPTLVSAATVEPSPEKAWSDTKETDAPSSPFAARLTNSTVNDAAVSAVGAVGAAHAAEAAAGVSSSACAGQWTADRIVGRCFGLKDVKETSGFDAVEVASAEHCQRICCELGGGCVTWQYWEGLRMCKVGKEVRLGKEGGPSPYWCDDSAPVQWFGRRVLSRNGTAVQWSARLATQCFGLGPERVKQRADPQRSLPAAPFTPGECQLQCRLSEQCNMWQAHPRRGCYFGFVQNAFCEPYSGRFFGGRKCREPYCSDAARLSAQ